MSDWEIESLRSIMVEALLPDIIRIKLLDTKGRRIDMTWAFITPLLFPPRGPRTPPGHPPKRTNSLFEAIKFLIIFWTRFWIDLGSFWGPNLGSFWALWAAKLGPKRVLERHFVENIDFSLARRFLLKNCQNGP